MEHNKPFNTAERLRQIMTERGLKQADILRLCDPICKQLNVKIGRNDLSQYVAGKVEPGQYKLIVLGRALNVSETWLMGFDVPKERPQNFSGPDSSSVISGIFPVKKKRFPILGKVACGEPTFAEENHEAWFTASADIDADFCLVAQGDSMTGAHIEDGDIVFIKQMDIVPNGYIAVVLIEDETTIKYIDYRPETSTLILTPANPAYRTQIYSGEELNRIRVLGMAVCLQKSLVKLH